MAGTAVDLTGQQITIMTGPDTAELWTIILKAPAQARVRFWTVEHDNCKLRIDLPQTMLQAALKGKTSLPPCIACTPAEALPDVSHGVHLACGQAHLVGTACGKAGPGECKHGVGWRTCPECAPLGGVTIEKVPGGLIGRPVEVDPYEPKILVQAGEPWRRDVLDLDTLCAVPGHDHGAEDYPPDMAAQIYAEYCAPAFDPVLAASFAPDPLELDLSAWASEPVLADGTTPDAHAGHGCSVDPERVAEGARGGMETGRATRHAAAQAHLDMIGAAISMPAKAATGKAGMSALAGCERKLGYRLLLGRPAGGPAWRPFVGTAAHGRDQVVPEGDEWRGPINLSEIYRADNEQRAAAGLSARWLIGVQVTEPAWGEVDVFDTQEGEVIDWKVPGITTVKKSWGGNVAENYRGQVQLNGLALELLGHEVRRVSVLLLPAAGELHDAGWWSAPYDPSAAWALVARRDKINAMAVAARASGAVDPEHVVLGLLSIREDHCAYCPAFGKYCPGAQAPKAPAPASLELVRP